MGDSTIATAYIQLTPSTDGLTDDIKQAMGEAGEEGGKSLNSSFGKVMKTVGTASVAAAGAAAAGVAAITKQAVDSYANYEQLVGGVDTLFGDASKTVQENAANAFRTAGLSANAYMESVTSFSASLLQSTSGDTQRAAEIADMAMIDMSDNANKMGTSMESIQNAYQGFAKQNYTMLDNLKLGYGGTKSEMERLLADAQELTGVEYNIDNLSDVYEAIHAVQENLGITGTTAKEAGETISGSLGAVQAAWQNVLTGIADENADFGQQLEDLINTVTAFLGNMIPRIATALGGVGELISGLVPVLLDQIPALLETALPTLLNSVVDVVNAILEALPGIFEILATSVLPMVVETAVNLILTLSNSLTEMLPTLIPVAIEAVLTLVSAITSNLQPMIEASIQVILALVQGIMNALPILLAEAPQIIADLTNALTVAAPLLSDAAIQIILTLLNTLIENAPELLQFAVELVLDIGETLVTSGLPAVINAGDQLMNGLYDGLNKSFEKMLNKIPGLMSKLTNKIKKTFGIASPSKVFAQIGYYLDEGLAVGIEDGLTEVDNAMTGLSDSVLGYTPTITANTSLASGATETATGSIQNTQTASSIVVPVYIGQKQIETIVVDALNNSAFLSGGR
jgi:phage-related protein